MTRSKKLPDYEVEHQIELLLSEEFLQEIREKIERDDEASWNDEWPTYLRRFFKNKDRLDTKFDFLPAMLIEVDRFVYYGERSLASYIFDALCTITCLVKGTPQYDLDRRDLVIEEIEQCAKAMFNNWEETFDSIDMFAPIQIEDFFNSAFTLMNFPSHKHLVQDQPHDDEDNELKYLYSVALYLIYEEFKDV